MFDTVIHTKPAPGVTSIPTTLVRNEMRILRAYLAANVLAWAALIGCVGYLCEQVLEGCLAFSLRTVFTIVTVVAVFLSVHRSAPYLMYPMETGWIMRLSAILSVAATLGIVIHFTWWCGATMTRRTRGEKTGLLTRQMPQKAINMSIACPPPVGSRCAEGVGRT